MISIGGESGFAVADRMTYTGVLALAKIAERWAYRCPNEYARERVCVLPTRTHVERKRRLEALDLAPEPVPLDVHVERAEQLLPAALRAGGGAGEQNGAGARAPHGLYAEERVDRLVQVREAHEERDRGGL
jgi:hypothetical protein